MNNMRYLNGGKFLYSLVLPNTALDQVREIPKWQTLIKTFVFLEIYILGMVSLKLLTLFILFVLFLGFEYFA